MSGGERKKQDERFVTKVHLELSCRDAVQTGGVADMLYKTGCVGGLFRVFGTEKKCLDSRPTVSVSLSALGLEAGCSAA